MRPDLASELNNPISNSGEIQARINKIIDARAGAVKSATAYHRIPVRHLNKRALKFRKPSFPFTRPISKIPATLGPMSINVYRIGRIFSESSGSIGKFAGPARKIIGPQESTKTKIK